MHLRCKSLEIWVGRAFGADNFLYSSHFVAVVDPQVNLLPLNPSFLAVGSDDLAHLLLLRFKFFYILFCFHKLSFQRVKSYLVFFEISVDFLEVAIVHVTEIVKFL